MRYGAKHAMWAPFEGIEPTSGMPKYGPAEDLGGINESNDTINFAEASAYADNAEKIHIKEFSNGTVAAKMLHTPFKTGSKILGTGADEEEGRSYGGDDDPPLGGYGFYSCYMDANKKRTYGVIFYPKVQGSVEGSNYKTKEDNITLEYDALSFNIMLPNCGKYKIEKRFDTEDEADNYLQGLFAGISPVPGLEGSGKGIGASAVVPVTADTDFGGGFGKAGQFFETPPTITWSGYKAKVEGELKHVSKYTAFSKSEDENTGHFFAVRLGDQYKGEEITAIATQEKTSVDTDWIVRVDKVMNTTKKIIFKARDVVIAEYDIADLKMGQASEAA